jgi:hypothetical protein
MTGCVHIICDYAPGDLAWSEILAALSDELPGSVRLVQTCVGSFDTVATGFAVAQLAARPSALAAKLVLFANCAPRKDLKTARKDNEGEGLVYAKLKNGAQLLVVNSGYSLSFVRDHIVELRATKTSNKGSQFRSRDNFPSAVAQCVNGDPSFLDKVLDHNSPDIIPLMPESVVAYVDSFGNIKTSIRSGNALLASLKEGDKVRILLNDTRRYATVTTGSFSVPEGELAFAPGSSGYGAPFWELFKRGGSAVREFGNPPCGARIEISLL